MIPIYKPYLPPNSLSMAHDALNSTWLSSYGKYIVMAQEKLQELLGVSYVLLLNNGTSACHLVAKSLHHTKKAPSGKKKIIVPNNVYVAAWNAFLFDGDYELIPVDADLNTWNIDLQKLDYAIKMFSDADVLIVHNIGNIINVSELQTKYPNVNFVEDNCEGLFGKYNNQFSGTASFASAISFFGNKNITSGEGGAFLTNDQEAYDYAKLIHGQGQSAKRFVHSELGYNYRMTNIQAAILCGQLDLLPEILDRKYNNFYLYRQAFSNREDVQTQFIETNTEHANWMFGIRIHNNQSYEMAELYFNSYGIEIRPMFYSIFSHGHLKGNVNIFDGSCNNADILNKECFILPSFAELTTVEINYIIQTVNNYITMLKNTKQ